MNLFWDQHADQAAIGAALVNHSAAVYVGENLPTGDLYRERDRRYLTGVVDLLAAGREVDAVTLAAHIGADADEKTELHGFAAMVPSTSNVAEYVAVVRDMARRRRLDQETRTALEEELAQGNGQGAAKFHKRMTEMLDREGGEQAAARRIPLVDWSTFWDGEHNEAEWAFEDVLARGRGHAIYASHKAGKSLLALYMAVEIATGPDQSVVVYLDYEMGKADVRERLEAMGHGPGSELSRLHYALLPALPPLDTAEGAGALASMLDRVQADWPGHHLVVIIDTIGRAVCGEENSADTFRAFYRHTGTELKRHGATWARLDHAGKDSSQGQRGSSSKGDDVDVVWRLTGTENGICLRRDLARMDWVPEKVTFRLDECPLSYTRLAGDWPEGTHEVALHLDRLKAPVEISVRAAAQLLRDHGVSRRGLITAAAVKWRKQRESAS